MPIHPKPSLENQRYQPGITDPQWPIEPPAGLDGTPASEYQRDLAGRVDRQKFMALATADLAVSNRDELREVMQSLSIFVREQMTKAPSTSHLPVLAMGEVPESYRVTITVGLGAKLFLDANGDDRFGLLPYKPQSLKIMPAFTGDGPGFSPVEDAADLIVVVSSDHPYVNVAILRAIADGYADMDASRRKRDPKRIRVRRIEQGFGRPDKREFLRFDDGIDNLSNATPAADLDRLVYVPEGVGEPDWCTGGSYLVYRKIREHLPVWEAFTRETQESMIGRQKIDGKPMSRSTEKDGVTPVFPDPRNPADGPLTAHIRKVQPRRPYPDLFGSHDLDRRFLRRPYPFFDGVNQAGEVICGLHFVAFMRDIKQQFEWITQMWQMNPDFPEKGTGIDALYGRGVLSTIAGGYYFCPPPPRGSGGYLGSGIFGE